MLFILPIFSLVYPLIGLSQLITLPIWCWGKKNLGKKVLGLFLMLGDPIYAILEIVVLLVILVLYMISFIAFPIFVFFSDFMPPFFFLTAAIGVQITDEEAKAQVYAILNEDFIGMLGRLVLSCGLYTFLALFMDQTQSLPWKNNLLFLPFFCSNFFIYLLKLSDGKIAPKFCLKNELFHYDRSAKVISDCVNYFRMHCITNIKFMDDL